MPADEVLVAFVFGMHHHCHVAEHGLGAGGGDGETGQSAHTVWFGQRIADVPHETIFFFLHHFQIGYGGVQFRIPVHQTFAAIDQAFVEQAHECFGDSFRQFLVHRKALARPVRRGAEAAHLLGDGVAGVFLPLPHFFDEFPAAQIVARDTLCVELAFDHDLRGDARMICSRLPQGVVAPHAVVARQRVHQRLVEAVPHVQRAGDVGRRQLDAERFGLARIKSCLEIAGLLPQGIPARFDVFRFKTFGEFHIHDFAVRLGVLRESLS
jgi:hypothetical protein